MNWKTPLEDVLWRQYVTILWTCATNGSPPIQKKITTKNPLGIIGLDGLRHTGMNEIMQMTKNFWKETIAENKYAIWAHLDAIIIIIINYY